MANVNPLITDVITQTQRATLTKGPIQASGQGKAYQSVAQSTAIAVQDATDALRNVTTVASTAAGVALAQILATGNAEPYQPTLDSAKAMVATAIQDFAAVGEAAGKVLSSFPSGPSS